VKKMATRKQTQADKLTVKLGGKLGGH